MNPYSEAPSLTSASSVHTGVPPEEEDQSLNDVTCPGDQAVDPLSYFGSNLVSAAGPFSAGIHLPNCDDFAAPCWTQGPYDHDFHLGVESTPTGLLDSTFGHHSSAQLYHQTGQPMPSFLSRPQPQISLPSSTWNSVNDQRFLIDIRLIIVLLHRSKCR